MNDDAMIWFFRVADLSAATVTRSTTASSPGCSSGCSLDCILFVSELAAIQHSKHFRGGRREFRTGSDVTLSETFFIFGPICNWGRQSARVLVCRCRFLSLRMGQAIHTWRGRKRFKSTTMYWLLHVPDCRSSIAAAHSAPAPQRHPQVEVAMIEATRASCICKQCNHTQAAFEEQTPFSCARVCEQPPLALGERICFNVQPCSKLN